MPFQKGHIKTGGRKPGSINKLTQEARDRLDQLKCDPITGMARIAMDRKAPLELRGRMYAELAQYAYPKLRSVAHTDPEGGKLFDIDAVRAFHAQRNTA